MFERPLDQPVSKRFQVAAIGAPEPEMAFDIGDVITSRLVPIAVPVEARRGHAELAGDELDDRDGCARQIRWHEAEQPDGTDLQPTCEPGG